MTLYQAIERARFELERAMTEPVTLPHVIKLDGCEIEITELRDNEALGIVHMLGAKPMSVSLSYWGAKA